MNENFNNIHRGDRQNMKGKRSRRRGEINRSGRGAEERREGREEWRALLSVRITL